MANVQKKITELVSIVQKKPTKQSAQPEQQQNIMRHPCEFCQNRMKMLAGGQTGRYIRRVWECPYCGVQVVEKIYLPKK